MIESFLYVTDTRTDGDGQPALLRFAGEVRKQAKAGWVCTSHTVSYDQHGGHGITAVFTRTGGEQ